MQHIYKSSTIESEQTIGNSTINSMDSSSLKKAKRSSIQFGTAKAQGFKVRDQGLQFGLLSAQLFQDNNTVVQFL
ncbi:hypothetical protein GGI12_006237 [Dipsacomyces acuminosporus]|nr:hypothetical protein GGI12_006237 [Dipsacomyces acuminosporus]